MAAPALDLASPDDLRSEIERLRAELYSARVQIAKLTGTVRDQAKTLRAVTDEESDTAPTLACLYWLWGPSRWHEPQWPRIAARLRPVLADIGDLFWWKATPMVWDAHRARRRVEPSARTGRPVSESMLNRELERAKEMLDWAVRNRLIRFNPLKSAKAVPTVSRRETWLPPAEIDKLLDACEFVKDDRLRNRRDDGLRAKVLRAFVLACHDSMLRPTEARTLLRDRIGSDGRVELAARQTKGRKRRIIFLTPRTLKAIADLPVDDRCPYVFNECGKVIHDKRLDNWFRKLCKMAGVDALAAPGDVRVHRHDLRASGASTADENGARATAIRDALGHSFLATTEIYLRSEQAKNAKTVADVMKTATGSGRRNPHTAPRRGPKKSGGR